MFSIQTLPNSYRVSGTTTSAIDDIRYVHLSPAHLPRLGALILPHSVNYHWRLLKAPFLAVIHLLTIEALTFLMFSYVIYIYIQHASSYTRHTVL